MSLFLKSEALRAEIASCRELKFDEDLALRAADNIEFAKKELKCIDNTLADSVPMDEWIEFSKSIGIHYENTN